MMPGENGIALTKSLRKDRKFPIIVLTAHSEPETRIEGLEAGADDYLGKGKPFDRATSWCCASTTSCAAESSEQPPGDRTDDVRPVTPS